MRQSKNVSITGQQLRAHRYRVFVQQHPERAGSTGRDFLKLDAYKRKLVGFQVILQCTVGKLQKLVWHHRECSLEQPLQRFVVVEAKVVSGTFCALGRSCNRSDISFGPHFFEYVLEKLLHQRIHHLLLGLEDFHLI